MPMAIAEPCLVLSSCSMWQGLRGGLLRQLLVSRTGSFQPAQHGSGCIGHGRERPKGRERPAKRREGTEGLRGAADAWGSEAPWQEAAAAQR